MKPTRPSDIETAARRLASSAAQTAEARGGESLFAPSGAGCAAAHLKGRTRHRPRFIGLLLSLVLLGTFAVVARQRNPISRAEPLPPTEPAEPTGAPTMALTNGALETQESPLTNEVSGMEELQAAGDAEGGADSSSADGAAAGGDLAQKNRRPGSAPAYNGRQARNNRLARERDRSRLSPGDAGFGSGVNSTNGPGKLDYAAFRDIVELNIFNPNRTRRIRGGPAPPETRFEYFSLAGYISYEKGTFALFNGSSSRYQKALKLNDSIAGFKLTSIAEDSVRLAAGTNQFELRMNMQMRREEDGDWQPSRAPVAYSASAFTGPSPGAETTTPSTSEAAASGSESDIVKRMMQRREQE